MTTTTMISFLGILVIIAFAALAYYYAGPKNETEDELSGPKRTVERISRLWDVAHQGMKEKRFLRAEKALLTILKIDEKNAAAYNRLGILYAKQKEYKDAIDCFEIASSIEPTPSSLHNLGLIYFEAENYNKAAVAFEQALKLESGLAARHIAYAKVQERLGNSRLMISELEKAVELEPNQEAYSLLSKAYRAAGRAQDADMTDQKIQKLMEVVTKPRAKKVLRPRRVVV